MNQLNHSLTQPDHYIAGRLIEPLEIIEQWQLNYHMGNAVKYISRAGRKVCEKTDLEKALVYLDRFIMKLSSSLKSLIYPLLTVSVLATMAFGASSETPQEDFDKVTNELSNNLGQVFSHLNNESKESVLRPNHKQLEQEYGDLFIKTLKHLTVEEKHLMKDLIMKAFERHYEKLTLNQKNKGD